MQFVKDLGADTVVDYKTEDFSLLLHNYNIVFDVLGGDVLKNSYKVLANGKLASIYGPKGMKIPQTEISREKILRVTIYLLNLTDMNFLLLQN